MAGAHTSDIVWLNAEQLATAYRSGELSPVEVTRATLERIEKLNPKLNAFLAVDNAGALQAAHAAENAFTAGTAGALTGIPTTIKDLLDVQGLVTTSGSLAYRHEVAASDSIVTERLKRAGAVILGKTNTPEFGLIASTENRLGDPCRNPWDLSRTAGGSSGGAAAGVAAGLGPLAIGTDGGGSIRIPAAWCGVYGIKPTYGRVARSGMSGMPLFSHTGPITRTVADAALMLDAIAGPDDRDVTSIQEPPPSFVDCVSAARIGAMPSLRAAWWPEPWGRAADPEMLRIVESAARSLLDLGITVEEAAPSVEDWAPIFRSLILVDEYTVSRHLLETKADLLTDYTRRSLEAGRDTPVHEYSAALRGLERFRWGMRRFFETFDLLLTPVTAVPAYMLTRGPEVATDRPADLWLATPYTAAFNLTGQPAASVPCGFTEKGLPVGLQVVGRWGDDGTIITVSAAYEQAHPWADRWPPLE
jgi:aspartyl-tRNA(Asn)/glutamyl-tRNA(Gln) amidotransferase subunit A